MEDSGGLILENLIKLTRSSENKFKRGNFKGALDDKIKANAILKSKSCDEKIIQEYRKELSSLYCSKFDLIFDHKQKINKINLLDLINREDQYGKYAWAVISKIILYSSSLVPHITKEYNDIDEALRLGFNLSMVPFEML